MGKAYATGLTAENQTLLSYLTTYLFCNNGGAGRGGDKIKKKNKK